MSVYEFDMKARLQLSEPSSKWPPQPTKNPQTQSGSTDVELRGLICENREQLEENPERSERGQPGWRKAFS